MHEPLAFRQRTYFPMHTSDQWSIGGFQHFISFQFLMTNKAREWIRIQLMYRLCGPSWNLQIKKFILTWNSLDKTLLEYMLLLYGSIDSLLPKIWAVDAVGIGARSKLFLRPYLQMTRMKMKSTLIPPSIVCMWIYQGKMMLLLAMYIDEV